MADFHGRWLLKSTVFVLSAGMFLLKKARLGPEVEECVHSHIFLTLNSQLFEIIGESEEGPGVEMHSFLLKM